MVKEGKGVLLDIRAELVLIHQDEVRVRLLAEEDEEILAGERDHLIQQRLCDRVTEVWLPVDRRLQAAEERFVLVEDENDTVFCRRSLSRSLVDDLGKIRRAQLPSLREGVTDRIVKETPAGNLAGGLARLRHNDRTSRRCTEIQASSCL